MNRRGSKPVEVPIVELQRELEEYRRSQPRRAKLPESIWEAAAAHWNEHLRRAGIAAGLHGIEEASGRRRGQRPANSKLDFVELM